MTFAVRAKLAWLRMFPDTEMEPVLAALVFLLVVILLRNPLANLATKALVAIFKSMSIDLNEKVQTETAQALRVVFIVGAALLVLDVLEAPAFFDGVVYRILVSVLVFAVFAAWYRLIDPLISILDPDKISEVNVSKGWLVRIGQFTVTVLAISAVLAVWDIDISNALTGVGVLGAGLAIAAQDFVRNLFAGMGNLSEKRFEPGDWIAVEGGIEGTVDAVDIRSTTIMGFDRVPMYVPNADLANAVVLNKGRMDHRRIIWTVPLVLEATDEQVTGFCDGMRSYMMESGDFVDDGSLLLVVTPTGLSDSALEIMVFGFTRTKDYVPYLDVCARLTLAVRREAAKVGTELAYPTQTVNIQGTPPLHQPE